MSSNAVINGEKIEKDNLIFEVLGCLDQASVEVGSAKLKAGDEISRILTQIQKDLASFSSIVAKCEPANHLQGGVAPAAHLGGETNQKLDWLENQIKSLEESVEIPKKFILSGESELEVRLNLARVAVRKTERRAVSLDRYQKLPKEMLDYLNRLSWLLFLLSLNS
jgi:cob(I)alamin adenosyltransferase